jgi:uncharacterized protein YbjT (DUF2867 family)
MILLTGATGTVGSQVVKHLQKTGAEFRIVARDPDKARSLTGPGIEIVQGDIANPASMQTAMYGIDHLFLLTPSGPQQLDVEKCIVDEAAKAGISHITKLSVMGASALSPILINQWHYYSEKYIEHVGIGLTAIRPTFFMQNTLMFAATIAAEGKFYAPLGNAAVNMVDARDIASVVVSSLIEPGHMGHVYDVTGPQAITYNEVASHISSVVGKTVTYVNATPEATRSAMQGMGMPEWFIESMLEYYEFFREGHGSLVTPVVERLKKSPPINYKQFAQDYASAFSS